MGRESTWSRRAGQSLRSRERVAPERVLIAARARDRRGRPRTAPILAALPTTARARDRALPAALAALAFALALLQRPGLASSDTKIDLHVDPAGFLADVASAWSSTGDLGHVQGGQYGGYLFPMGPFFALLYAVGGSPWLVQRLWFALILFLAAWGAARLMEELRGPPAPAGAPVPVYPHLVGF